MDYRISSYIAVILATSPLYVGQRPAYGQEAIARQILDLSVADQIAFITSTMDQGFLQERSGQMTMLIINRSALTVPLIEARLEEVLKSPSLSENFIDIASEMIAYAGDEQSLRAISRLIAIDEGRFGRLVGRTLDNSTNWRNSFTVAYRGIEIGDEAITRHILAWTETALASDRMKQRWAEAMLDRYGKVPGQAEWAQDPLASRIKREDLATLRERVMRLAADVWEKPKRQ
jgi:hypothetical protein